MREISRWLTDDWQLPDEVAYHIIEVAKIKIQIEKGDHYTGGTPENLKSVQDSISDWFNESNNNKRFMPYNQSMDTFYISRSSSE